MTSVQEQVVFDGRPPTVDEARAVAAGFVRRAGYPMNAEALLSGKFSSGQMIARLGLAEQGEAEPLEPLFSALVRLYQAERRERPCASCGSGRGVPCHAGCPQPRG